MRGLVIVTMLVALRSIASAQPSAELLYSEGQEAFDRGDYATAVSRWQASYQISKLPLLVFNIAQAHRLAGECSSALSAYREYVTLDPGSAQRSLADGFVAELEPRCGPLPTPRIDPVPRPNETPRSRRSLRLAGLVTGGSGVAIVVTGLVFGRRASTLGDEVTRNCAVSCDWGIEGEKERDGKRYATIGKILDGVGLAAVGVGTVLYIYGLRERQPAIAAQPSGHGATLTWSGQW